jgi:hypothetical protein
MTTPDIAGLCEKLRAVESSGHGTVTTNWHRNPDGPEAAATIERQAAEIERLRGALAFYADQNLYAGNSTSGWTAAGDDSGAVARAALTGEDACLTLGTPN